MRKIIHRLTVSVIAMALFLFLVSSANAVPIHGETGLSGPHSTITFSENPFTPVFDPAHPDFLVYPPAIGTDYSSLGVTFSGDIGYANTSMYIGTVPHFSGDIAVNFSGNGHWLITFNSLLNGVAFAYGSDPATTTFTALRNGVPIEQFTADTGCGCDPTNNIFGFQNILFDQVMIDAGLGRDFGNGIDNLQFSAVPEPSTFILMGIGVLALSLIGRKKLLSGSPTS